MIQQVDFNCLEAKKLLNFKKKAPKWYLHSKKTKITQNILIKLSIFYNIYPPVISTKRPV